MIKREEFECAIKCLLGELTAICASKEPADLRLLLGFEAELREARAVLQDPEAPPNAVVSTAAGLVDEFVHRLWDEVIDKAYSFYLDQCAQVAEREKQGSL